VFFFYKHSIYTCIKLKSTVQGVKDESTYRCILVGYRGQLFHQINYTKVPRKTKITFGSLRPLHAGFAVVGHRRRTPESIATNPWSTRPPSPSGFERSRRRSSPPWTSRSSRWTFVGRGCTPRSGGHGSRSAGFQKMDAPCWSRRRRMGGSAPLYYLPQKPTLPLHPPNKSTTGSHPF
jgi:hypothetical protein